MLSRRSGTVAALRAYPKTTVIAEKLHAVSVLGTTTSRMKDSFNRWVLLRDEAIGDAERQRAIEATFARRQTAVPSPCPRLDRRLRRRRDQAGDCVFSCPARAPGRD